MAGLLPTRAQPNVARKRAMTTAAATVPATTARPPTAASRLQGMTPQQKTQFQQWIAAQGQAPVGPGASPAPALGLPGTQEAAFGAARDRTNEQYLGALNDNQYAHNQTENGYVRQFRDLATRQGQERTQEPMQFIQRGILGSGIAHEDLSQLLTQHLRQGSDLRADRAGQLGTIDHARNQIESARSQALAEIEAQRQAAIAKFALGRF